MTRTTMAAGFALMALAAGAHGRAQVPASPAVLVDAAATRPPMSRQTYGQFIEAGGRCMDGSLWAEMIEDRKFLHPVAEGESPWMLLGEPRSVSMSTTKAFVGQHSPDLEFDGISGPAGISQAGLGVVAGARYTGRLVMAGTSEAGPIEVSLVWGAAPSARQTVTIRVFDERYRPYPLAFSAGASSDDARLEIVARGKGRVRIGAVSLMPANNVAGFRADTLALLRELNAPVYRWPGGNPTGGEAWQGDLDDRDRRPPRMGREWKGVESNDVGPREFTTLCSLVGAEADTKPGEEDRACGARLCGEPGARYSLKDALAAAAWIHGSSRHADMTATAGRARTANTIGAIRATKTAATLEATGQVLKLYRAHFGQVPVTITGTPAPLDVAAAWREDRSALTIAIVNPTAGAQRLGLQLKGGTFGPAAMLRRIAGTDPMAFNEPGKPPAVKIEEATNVPVGSTLTVPALSVSIYELRIK